MARTIVAACVVAVALNIAAGWPAVAPVDALAGCQPARPHAAGSSNETIVSGALTRQYILHVPPSYDGSTATPLVFNFHGYGSSAAAQEFYSGISTKADAAGFIAVIPQGTGAPARWNFTTVDPGLPSDVTFVSELLDALHAQLCVDANRVYSAGISNGAAMTVRLGCNLSDRVAAIAPVSGVFFPIICPSTRPVPLITFHGTADPLVPYLGGVTPQGYPVGPVPNSVQAWAVHDGCTAGPVDTQVTAHVTRRAYAGCEQATGVELYTIDGGGHTWPDATIDLPVDVYGATTHEISANDLMWAFFSAHPLGGAGVGGVTELTSVASYPGAGSGANAWPIASAVGALALLIAIGGVASLRRVRR